MSTASARAHPNIAFIKYWGNRNHELRLPSNSSLSMNLDGLHTLSSVSFDAQLKEDRFTLNGASQQGKSLKRLSAFLDIVRAQSDLRQFALVESENNFPMGAGIASSSSAFAALALAASRAAGLDLDEKALTRLARRGSGSASRSVPTGFVEWHSADEDEDSFALSIAPPQHWGLVDCIAVVSEEHKATGSSEGHQLAESSLMQAARVQGAEERLARCRQALLARNFETFAEVVELDSSLMHAVMMSSRPPLLYWQAATMAVVQGVRAWRGEGLAACSTIDAGPNVHVLCLAEDSDEVSTRLEAIPGVDHVLQATPGGPTEFIQ